LTGLVTAPGVVLAGSRFFRAAAPNTTTAGFFVCDVMRVLPGDLKASVCLPGVFVPVKGLPGVFPLILAWLVAAEAILIKQRDEAS